MVSNVAFPAVAYSACMDCTTQLKTRLIVDHPRWKVRASPTPADWPATLKQQREQHEIPQSFQCGDSGDESMLFDV